MACFLMFTSMASSVVALICLLVRECHAVLLCMYWVVLHCVTMCYPVLHCITQCYIVLQCPILNYTVLHCIPLHPLLAP